MPEEAPTAPDEARAEVLYDVGDNGVATITINRPERRNALSWGVIGELRRRVAEAKADTSVRVVVFTGAGEKAFCAGADLGGMAAGASYLDLHEGRGELAELFHELWALGKPTIARVRGYAPVSYTHLTLPTNREV